MTDKPTKSGTAGKKGVHEGDVAFEGPTTRTTLKVRKIGNSLGVVLPKDVLEKLGAQEGDTIDYVVSKPGALEISVSDADVDELMALAEDIMEENRTVLRALAK